MKSQPNRNKKSNEYQLLGTNFHFVFVSLASLMQSSAKNPVCKFRMQSVHWKPHRFWIFSVGYRMIDINITLLMCNFNSFILCPAHFYIYCLIRTIKRKQQLKTQTWTNLQREQNNLNGKYLNRKLCSCFTKFLDLKVQ